MKNNYSKNSYPNLIIIHLKLLTKNLRAYKILARKNLTTTVRITSLMRVKTKMKENNNSKNYSKNTLK